MTLAYKLAMTRTNQVSGPEDSFYLVNSRQKEVPAFAPYSTVNSQSTVSSFNLSIQYDSSSLTPTSMDDTSLAAKPVPSGKREPETKLSPAPFFPTNPMYYPEDDYGISFNTTMKCKDYSRPLPISTADSFFPHESPLVCPSPYYGHYRASAPPQSTITSLSSPNFTMSPIMLSSGSCSVGSYSGSQTPVLSHHSSSYRGSQGHTSIAPNPSSPPILIAPSPGLFRSVPKLEGAQRVRGSFQGNKSTYPSDETPRNNYCREVSSASSSKGTKRKASPLDYEKLMACPGLNEQDRYLLQLSIGDRIPWKEIAIKYNEAFPLKTVQVPALQMRKKRIVERFREWSKLEERALALSYHEHDSNKWHKIAKGMHKHGCDYNWSVEAVERKWNEMQSTKRTS
ncbi:hypothetical protein QTJ16_004839 [Diplocarpon rosae]|uniref:Myb-like domain-containing protein n=1 Tax=Diplocarpon rosae TaxID=946125 RepID=A0AAD9SXU3_9HELO|nr:hypothetical protein QTJ16_004839 [Diplocarpon rosae]